MLNFNDPNMTVEQFNAMNKMVDRAAALEAFIEKTLAGQRRRAVEREAARKGVTK